MPEAETHTIPVKTEPAPSGSAPAAPDAGVVKIDGQPKPAPEPQAAESAFKSVVGDDLTDEWNPPKVPPLPLDEADIQAWVNTLSGDRLLILRCVDDDVMLCAEHAIATHDKFASMTRSKLKPPRARAGKKDEERENATFENLLGQDLGRGPRLIIIRAYDWPNPADALEGLPRNRARLDDVRQRLIQFDRYLLFVTYPGPIVIDEGRLRLGPFTHVAGFLKPLLAGVASGKEAAEELEIQYRACYWTPKPNNPELDKEFHEQVLQVIRAEKIQDIIAAGKEAREQHGQLAAQYFSDKLQQIIALAETRAGGWPAKNDFLGQTMLFVAAFLQGLPAQDYAHLVKTLVGSDARRIPVPQRTHVAGEKKRTCAYQDVALAEIFESRRTGLIHRWGLRCDSSSHIPSIACDSPQDASLIKDNFAGQYPFTFVELWERMVKAGLLFDGSEKVAEKWTEIFVKRVAGDPLFAQTFALDLLFADNALSSLEGSLEERLEALGSIHRTLIIRRFSDALIALLDSEKTSDRVGEAIEILIAMSATRFALTLLRRLSYNYRLQIRKRIGLVTLILNHSGKEYWEEASYLLARWAADPNDGWETLSTISSWLEKLGPQTGGVINAVAGALATAVQQWFTVPSNEPHPLIKVLECAERDNRDAADSIPTLVKALFHPAVEMAVTEVKPYAAAAAWLAPGDDRRTAAVKEQVHTRLREPVYQAFQFAFAQGQVTAPAARAFQCAVLADWSLALEEKGTAPGRRDLLLAAIFETTPASVPAELQAVWREMQRAVKFVRATISNSDPTIELLREALHTIDRRVNAISAVLEDAPKRNHQAARVRTSGLATVLS